jgi:hypothetical protein
LASKYTERPVDLVVTEMVVTGFPNSLAAGRFATNKNGTSIIKPPVIITIIRNLCIAAALLLAGLNVVCVKAEDAKEQPLTAAQLEQLLAPIALYPDPLLAEVLMASTYPLDIVQAERWLQNNKNLEGDPLKAATDKQTWDESVKSLIATPDVLAMMSSKIEWTQKLGDAVVAQHAEVMDAVQRLRAKAQANNKLTSTKEQTVAVEQVENRQVITIEPTQPDTVYVPYYDPNVVYGGWPYSDYPPYYFPPPAYIGAGIIATGIAFGAGYALGRWAAGGSYWGGSFNWNNNNININRPINGAGTNWSPRVEHRQAGGNRGGRQQGLNFRGSGGHQVLNPGANRGNLGNRTQTGNRPNAGAGNRRANAGAGNRGPSAGTRPARGGQGHHVANRSGRTGHAHHGGAGAGHAHRGGGAHRAGGGVHRGGGGTMRAHGGGRMHAGGMRGGGRGGRRSDVRLKHDVMLLGRLGNGLGLYRFIYNGGHTVYVGVMAQEVQLVAPEDVVRDRSGYLRVLYEKLGLRFQTYEQWVAAGSVIAVKAPGMH